MPDRPDDRLRRHDDAGFTAYDDMIRTGRWAPRAALAVLLGALLLGFTMLVTP